MKLIAVLHRVLLEIKHDIEIKLKLTWTQELNQIKKA